MLKCPQTIRPDADRPEDDSGICGDLRESADNLLFTATWIATTCDYYQNDSNQTLEVRKNGDADAYEQYVYDQRYIDAPVMVYRDTNTDAAVDQNLYITQDANFNVTATVNGATGAVANRFIYTPYGQRTVLTSTWTAGTTDFMLGHQGLYLDGESGLYYNRARYLHPTLGTFIQRDPLGYVDGMSVYQYEGSSPILHSDATGLEWKITRDGGARATASGGCDDTIAGLAKVVKLEPKEFKKWLKSTDGRDLPSTVSNKLGQARVFSVPNQVLIVVGDTNYVAAVFLGRWADRVDRAFMRRGFSTVMVSNLSSTTTLPSTTISGLAGGNTWGLAFFGHGKGSGTLTGDLVISSRWWGEPTDSLSSNGFGAPHFKYGGVLTYFCYSNLGNWRSLVSSNGTYLGTRGVIAADGGPRSLSPSYWGSWDSVVGTLTGVP